MATFVLTCYFFILGVLCVYGAHRIYITLLFRKNAKVIPGPEKTFRDLPRVTVQLPVFNEKFVVQRLIDAAAAIRYPKDRLQIQVLDDSTDETTDLAEERVAFYRQQGLDMELIHREDRSGYKAGALANGMGHATGEFIAIFDADFVPDPDILQRTIHYFTQPKVGMVQTRWEHLNRGFNTLTRIQAVMLDAHFVIEHGGRCYSGLFFNFNGTAGIWRRETIEAAGGWQHDTLTEDLDLSYRAQLKGWSFLFLPDITCPAELPTTMKAFKSQQYRWAKGAIQVMLKLLPRIFRSRLPMRIRMEAFFHLSGNLAYVLMMINSLFFVVPSMVIRADQAWWRILFIDGPLFLMASLSFIFFYLSSQRAIFHSVKGRVGLMPALMAVGIGMGINNTRAVLEALLGIRSGFVRTPKIGVSGEGLSKKAEVKQPVGYHLPKSAWGYLELLLGVFYTGSIFWAIFAGNWASIPFLVLFQNGFLYVGWLTIREDRAPSAFASVRKSGLEAT